MKKICDAEDNNLQKYQLSFDTILQARSVISNLKDLWSVYSGYLNALSLVASTKAGGTDTQKQAAIISYTISKAFTTTYPISIFFGTDGNSIDEAIQTLSSSSVNWGSQDNLELIFQQLAIVWNTNATMIKGMYDLKNATIGSIVTLMIALGNILREIDELNQLYMLFLSKNAA